MLVFNTTRCHRNQPIISIDFHLIENGCVHLVLAAQADLPALEWIARLHTHLDTLNTGMVPTDTFRPTLLDAGMGAMEVERVLH